MPYKLFVLNDAGLRSRALSFRQSSRPRLYRFGFHCEPDPIFGDREPGIGIFRLASVASSIQAFLCIFAISVSVRKHLNLNINSRK